MGRVPDLGRTVVMGVVNVTPDSFSESGRHFDTDVAITHGLELAASGADIVDVGGESTRPGAQGVDPAEEARRVVPVIAALTAEGVMVSVDTMHCSTAAAALSAGARIINDVSGGLADPDLPRLVAEAQVPYVVMHWRGHSADMQSRAHYDDVVGEVCAELTARAESVVAAGVAADAIIIDPGLGFAKTAEHNWALLAHLDRILAIGPPVLVGASRKSFLGSLLATDGQPRPVADREAATTAITALVADAGVWGVRVHEPAASADAVRVVAAIRSAG
ncbi:MAG TPA: dihydropteroate synthase [Mycobacteriales bacterium]|nr:dihydropteroate synthase [Mycobacteriales bacterium]